MENVLTVNQRLLTRYLAAVGCKKSSTLKMIFELWDEEPVLEMFEFCRDHPNATENELLKASSEISSKYPRYDEEE